MSLTRAYSLSSVSRINSDKTNSDKKSTPALFGPLKRAVFFVTQSSAVLRL
jgi:hypothetical protein